MMNFSKIFGEGAAVTIPAGDFMHLVYDAIMFGILEQAFGLVSKEEFLMLAAVVIGPFRPSPPSNNLEATE